MLDVFVAPYDYKRGARRDITTPIEFPRLAFARR
jgi:hypothetical protein